MSPVHELIQDSRVAPTSPAELCQICKTAGKMATTRSSLAAHTAQASCATDLRAGQKYEPTRELLRHSEPELEKERGSPSDGLAFTRSLPNISTYLAVEYVDFGSTPSEVR